MPSGLSALLAIPSDRERVELDTDVFFVFLMYVFQIGYKHINNLNKTYSITITCPSTGCTQKYCWEYL